MTFLFEPPPIVSLAVRGEAARFPVRRILCVGRNYAAHAREMGADPEREPPFFFSKPRDALVSGGQEVRYPPLTANLHHEVELVVGLAAGGRDLSAEQALALVYGYGVGVDLTRRDLQEQAKQKGHPWDFAKGFDQSAPCSELVPATRIGHPSRGRIWLRVNDVVAQDGDLTQMTWNVAEVIATASRAFELAAGDLLFTGTPAGVGPLVRGDRVQCGVDGVAELAFAVV